MQPVMDKNTAECWKYVLIKAILIRILLKNRHLTMNGQRVSVRIRPSLRMCSLWPLLRISFFLRTLMAKRHLMLLFNCTWERWKAIDYIIETWNLDLCQRVWAAVRSPLTRSTWPNSPTARVQLIWKSLKVADERRSGSLSGLDRTPEVSLYSAFFSIRANNM